jgi:hypothetical protein
MAYRLQFRKDTRENWELYNPQLADGEIGLIRGTNLYKIGDPNPDGTLKFWNDLPLFGFNGRLSDNLNVADNEEIDNEAVNKRVLVEKFASIDEMLSNVDLEDDTSALKILLNDLSTRIGTTEDNVGDINTNIGTIEDNVESIQKDIYGYNPEEGDPVIGIKDKIGTIEKDIYGYDPEEGDPVIGIKEKVVGIEEKVEILENRIQVVSASEWGNLLLNPSMINEGVLYYTYEE